MRLLYIHQYYCPPGGSGNNRSHELALNWVKAGHQVTMLSSKAYFPLELKEKPGTLQFNQDGIEVIALDVAYSHMMPFRQRIAAFLWFYAKAKRFANGLGQFDLIYASSTPPSVGELGRKLAAKWNIPFVFECVDVWPDVPAGMGLLKNRSILAWINKRLDHIYKDSALIVALSEGMKAQICSHGVDSNKVLVRHNGTNLQAFPFQERTEPAGPLKVIYTGTVGIANGLDALLRLAALAEKEMPGKFEFEVLGGGNDLERIKGLANVMGLKSLRFLKPVPKEEVNAFLAKADIGIVTFAPFPVLEANSANKFYDYLASGLPILTNYQGWQAEYLQTHACGLSAPQGDDRQLFANLKTLAEDGVLRKSMGKKGRALAELHFDREKIAAQLLEDFQKVLKK